MAIFGLMHGQRGWDLRILALTIWGEARNQDALGKLAVAWTIRNRALDKKKWNGDSIADCCLKPFQYSCWNASDPNRALLEKVTVDDDAFLSCLAAACWVINGQAPDPTSGATHYHTKSMNPFPPWASSPTMHETVRIGEHIFYKED